MKILAIEKEIIGVTKDQFTAELKKAEAIWLWKLYQSGKIRELYFRSDRDEAVLVIECIDTSEANSVLNTLPLMKAGLIDFDIILLKAYPGFSRLFSATTGA